MLSKLPLPRRLSTQTYLLALVAAVVIPLLAFAAFLLTRYAETERARFEAGAAQLARQVGLIVDGELAGLVAVLKGLATSSALTEGDFGQFYLEARRLVLGSDQIVVLRDLGTRQFLNTQLPFGSPLPPAIAITPAESAAFAAGRPVISEVYLSPVSGEARVAAAIPVFRDDRPKYILAITVPTSRILGALAPAVPPGWIIGVGDRDGTYVARSERHEEFT
ncbi:MAG TPA: histidine kinase, partial [Propylenella sp.]|nr:histidine kinase [Propylenella sp.]